ncbi:hypothetical protein OG389_11580 [Streptomyces sp. NBC_00435]|uniref:hypothetical protein n=1 Tax=Streptomyces sp. NBC_00435 TaxID=2903649 RepID=UPI002E20AF3A
MNGIQRDGRSPLQVREEYLTTELDDTLTAWGSEYQVEPILRAQNLPKTWSSTA